MKNKLFGSRGRWLKDNGIIAALCVAIGAAALFSYNTIKNINYKLENQRMQNIAASQSDKTEDVATPQSNVPIASSQRRQSSSKKAVSSAAAQSGSDSVRRPAPAFILPAQGKIFAAFSGSELVYNRTMDDWRTHNGMDISAAKGEPVKAAAPGKVEKIYTDGLLGTVIEVNHGDYIARYCGLAKKTFVNRGDSVEQGQNMGTVEEVPMEVSEESHLHLEIIKDGEYINLDTLLK